MKTFYLCSIPFPFNALMGAYMFLSLTCCNGDGSQVDKIIFQDDFSLDSQGQLVENVIQLPPPIGLDYDWNVLYNGHLPTKWIMVDEIPLSEPRKGFWVIPGDSGYMEQGGRSHNSVLFATTPVPAETKNYDISFHQFRSDNDYIGYIIGAAEPSLQAGLEFGYMTQVPGTDSTTTHAYVEGDLGEKMVPGMALTYRWAKHLIAVRGDTVSWFVEGNLLISSLIKEKPKAGYFGIRQRYERGTRYDDVKITGRE